MNKKRMMKIAESRNHLLTAAASLLCIILTIVICISGIGYTVLDYGMAVIAAAAFIIFAVREFKLAKEARDRADDFVVKGDENGIEKLVRRFREGYSAFYEDVDIKENAQVQNYTTQIFRNILELRRRRLDSKGVKLLFSFERQKYDKIPLMARKYFDGKYQISETTEYILAQKDFVMDGKSIFMKKQTRAAFYTMVNAKAVGNSRFICPCCGNESRREDLIDGCDYCGTKFTVEDLGRKISDFSLRDDYKMQYERFKKLRKKLNYSFWYGSFIVSFLFVIFIMCVLTLDEGIDLNPLFTLFSMLAIGGSFAMLIGFLIAAFYFVLILPVLQGGASYNLYSRRKLDKMKHEAENDEASERRVRKNDPLFSFSGFSSNIGNKLATVIFAENADQINAFAEVDLSELLKRYANVIDVDLDKMTLDDYRTDEREQTALVTADMTLLQIDGRKAKERHEKVRLRLVKDANCKTQAVCAPSLLRCSSCGASISPVEGFKCSYCARKPDLKLYDWTITDWEI